jgi:hypothetical protein
MVSPSDGQTSRARTLVVPVAAAAVCVFAAGATLRLALGEAAVGLGYPLLPSPRMALVDPEAFERLAELETDQSAESAQALWRETARLNRRSSVAWIALGLAGERRKNFAEAERDLLIAASVDRQYLPAWTLANFYFRRGNPQDFWPWARRAAALSYGDLIPLVRLCDLMNPDGLAGLGDPSAIDHAYFDLLIHGHRLDDAQKIARRMLARGVLADRPRLIAYTSLQIDAGHTEAAREIWDGLFPAAMEPAPVLSNGDFRSAPTGQGFDWNISGAPGIRSQWQKSRVGFFLSGNQPETCVLLEQPVVLRAGRYSLRFAYSISGGEGRASGLRWAIDSKLFRGMESPPFEGTGGSTAWAFRTPVSGLARLQLFYRREAGTPPAKMQPGTCRHSDRAFLMGTNKAASAARTAERARRCPRCGSERIQPSHLRGAWERILHALGGQIRRCHSCSMRQAWFGVKAVPLGRGRTGAGPISAAVVVATGLIVFLTIFWWILARLAGRSS